MEYMKTGNNYIVRIDRGEEVLVKVEELCKKEEIRLGAVTGLGACSHVAIGLFDTVDKVYRKIDLNGPMEITSLVGNISTKEGETYLHFHINVCDTEMNVHGGHLNACDISATCELCVTKFEGTVEREMDEDVGLNLYKFV